MRSGTQLLHARDGIRDLPRGGAHALRRHACERKETGTERPVTTALVSGGQVRRRGGWARRRSPPGGAPAQRQFRIS